ncbi:MAG: helix-turn-helix domain-containing protein [Acidobacteriota bacterium]
MSLSLGEKLRQAREEQGISISEVAEQTRISPHYLESIEKNSYKILPGGIFNKGFIKAFARYVGVNEAEALQDYIQAIGEAGEPDDQGPKPYHPEVLTDDRAGPSMTPTVIFAVIILALMTGGILFVVKYLQGAGPISNQAALTPPTTNTNTANVNAAVPVPATDKISVELKASAEPVWVSYSVDGVAKVQTLAPDESVKIDAKDAFTLSYSKAKLANLQVSVNGKQIAMTSSQSKGNVEFEVTRANVDQVVQGGQTAPLESSPTGSASPAATQTPKHTGTPEASKTPRPSPAGITAPRPSPTVIIVGNKKPTTPPRPN